MNGIRRQSSRSVFVPLGEASPPPSSSCEDEANVEYSAKRKCRTTRGGTFFFPFFQKVHCEGKVECKLKRFLQCADEICLFPLICVKERHSHEKFWADSQTLQSCQSTPHLPLPPPLWCISSFMQKESKLMDCSYYASISSISSGHSRPSSHPSFCRSRSVKCSISYFTTCRGRQALKHRLPHSLSHTYTLVPTHIHTNRSHNCQMKPTWGHEEFSLCHLP